MKKSLIIIGIVILIIIILFIGAWIWFDGLKEDKLETQEKMDEIKEVYPNFNQAVNDFSNLRNEFYNKKENLFLETLKDNADEWNSFINSYKDAIQKVENNALKLKKNCNIEYGDVGVSTKCDSFKVNYEAAQNYYITDIKLYNEMVDEYDKYNLENGNTFPKINKGEFIVYKDYIDYDKDGEYFGKEVSDNEE